MTYNDTTIKNYYLILDISDNASNEEIKKAYRRLALIYHPDINKLPNAHIKFIEIHEAYEILADPLKRNLYNKEYERLYKNTGVKVFVNNNFQKDYYDWVNSASKTGEKYSKMNFDDYKSKIIDNLFVVYEGTKKVTKIGCLLYFGLAFLGSALYGVFLFIKQLIDLENGETNFHIGFIFVPIMIFIFGFIGYLFLKRTFE